MLKWLSIICVALVFIPTTVQAQHAFPVFTDASGTLIEVEYVPFNKAVRTRSSTVKINGTRYRLDLSSRVKKFFQPDGGTKAAKELKKALKKIKKEKRKLKANDTAMLASITSASWRIRLKKERKNSAKYEIFFPSNEFTILGTFTLRRR